MNLLTFPAHKIKNQQQFVKMRDFSAENLLQFRNALNSINWAFVTSLTDPNESFNEFLSTFSDLFNIYFPDRLKKKNRNTTPINDFMTKGLLISRNTKNLLHKNYLANRTAENFNNYKKYRSLYYKILNLSKNSTVKNKLALSKKNPKKNMVHF